MVFMPSAHVTLKSPTFLKPRGSSLTLARSQKQQYIYFCVFTLDDHLINYRFVFGLQELCKLAVLEQQEKSRKLLSEAISSQTEWQEALLKKQVCLCVTVCVLLCVCVYHITVCVCVRLCVCVCETACVLHRQINWS